MDEFFSAAVHTCFPLRQSYGSCQRTTVLTWRTALPSRHIFLILSPPTRGRGMHELVLHSACFQPLFLVSNLLKTNANVAFRCFQHVVACARVSELHFADWFLVLKTCGACFNSKKLLLMPRSPLGCLAKRWKPEDAGIDIAE